MNAHASTIREAPNAIDNETALLGAILVNNDAYQSVSAFLRSEHFYDPLNRLVYETVAALIAQGKPATPLTIKPYLPSGEKVGELTVGQFLARLAAHAGPPIMARNDGMVIVDMAEYRKLVMIGEDLTKSAYAPDPSLSAPAIAAEFESALAELRAESPKDEGPGTARRAVEKLRERALSDVKARTVPWPLQQLREVNSGDMEAGNLYGLLSSSGEGKTSLALQIIRNAAENGHPVLFLSYDQSDEQSFQQMATQITGIEGRRIRDKTMQEREWERYLDALKRLGDLPIVVQKCHREGIAQIGNHARRFIKRYAKSEQPALVVLDHTRKVAPRDPKAHEGRIASEINGSCKAFAGELDCAWLNLNQRNGYGMRRDNPRPISADLFGGEQAKEDYDTILYLYRPDKYREDQMRIAKNEREKQAVEERFSGWEGRAELGALKVRFGDGMVRRKVAFEKDFTRYVSLRDEIAPSLLDEFVGA